MPETYAPLKWDEIGERKYEVGVDHCALYLQDESGAYSTGFAWNGVTGVTDKPSGADATALYADNIKYLELRAAEDFGLTLEAYMYPDEFEECDGAASLLDGVSLGQQTRKRFGLAYRTKIGNDIKNEDYGYKLHLVYGCTASPSEKSYSTINESPDAVSFSWDITTTPVPVTGYRPSATITIDSTKFTTEQAKANLAALEAILFGSTTAAARLPLPDEVKSILTATGQ